MKKFICLILIILNFSFSVVPSFAVNDGIATLAVANTYTIDQILDQGYVSVYDDGLLFTGINLITYLDYLLTDESHTCSTFGARWCDVKEAYKSTREIVNANQYKNFYLVWTVNASGYYDYTYIYSNSELISDTSKSVINGDYVSFGFRFKYSDTTGILGLNRSNNYTEGTNFSISLGSSNVIMSTTNIYDSNGNLVFEKNVFDEEELPPEDTGSDVTLGGISNIIDGVKQSISDLKDTITGFFSEIKENNEFIKSLFGNNDLATALATKFWDSILERFNNFFSYIGDGFNLIKIIFNSLPEPLNYFIWVPFSLLILFGFFKKLL